MSDKFDIDAINASINLPKLVGRYIELKPRGKEFVGLCRWHSDSDPSFTVYEKDGKWQAKCFSCGEYHSGAVGFLMAVENIQLPEACRRLLNGSGTQLPVGAAPVKKTLKKAPPRKTFAAPAGTEPPKFRIKREGVWYENPVQQWEYHDAAGGTIGYVVRFNLPDGSKEFPTWTWGQYSDEDPAQWAPKHFATPRPLYGLDLLAERPDAQVLILEGEKAAEAARMLFPSMVAITWPAGANAYPYADWSVLAGRKVVLIPDADDAGRQAMSRIAVLLHELGAAEIKGVEVDTIADEGVEIEAPRGWDLADAINREPPLTDWTPEIALAWAKARIVRYDAVQQEQQDAIKRDLPHAEQEPPVDTETPVESQEAPKSQASAPELGVVDGNTVRKPKKRQEIEPEADLPPEFSETGLAYRFVDQHGEDWRYTRQWSAWHRWDGVTWVEDIKNAITWEIQECCKAAQSQARYLTGAQKNRIMTLKIFNSVSTLAGANPAVAVAPDEWDAQTMLLGTPAGIVDLRTGEMIEATKTQLISKKTLVAPARGPHPYWDKVLERAHRGDESMRDFIQRWCGYLLTGDTREERFLFIHGPGRGGKSKFLEPIVNIMNDYSRTAKIESFTAKDRSEHSEEVARLAGARIVTASETEEGQRWNESRIKQLTGRDKIAARHMHKSTFEFVPQFKLIFIGNHKPALRSVGEEMKARLDLLEWGGTIPQQDRILDMPEKLRAEYPAILQWMIDGCMLWQKNGLSKPQAVISSVEDYMQGEDTLGTWLEDCCDLSESGHTSTGEAYNSFKKWAEQSGEYVPSKNRFSQKLQTRGFAPYRNTKSRGYIGFTIRPREYAPPEYG